MGHDYFPGPLSYDCLGLLRASEIPLPCNSITHLGIKVVAIEEISVFGTCFVGAGTAEWGL